MDGEQLRGNKMYNLDNNFDGSYDKYILNLRNDKELRKGFINQTEIHKNVHQKFMDKHRQDYFVCVNDDGIPMGFIGVVDGDIRLAVDPDYQKQGVGKFMVNEIHKKYPKAIARVKTNNKASHALFVKCGFKVTGMEFKNRSTHLYIMER